MNSYFDAIFCINLKRRTDRLRQAKEEFLKHNINIEFIDGIDGRNMKIKDMISQDGSIVSRGDIGCTLTHLKIAKLAKERQLSNYFVFEDDIELIENFNELFQLYYMQIPNDWDFIYLGGNHAGPLIQVMPNVSRMTYSYTTHAYAAKNTIYDAIITELGKENEKVDIGMASLHSKYNTYVTRPHLAFQRASFSDILNKDTDYKHLRA